MIGKIIKIEADLFECLVESNYLNCKATKIFQYKKQELKVGDNVEIEVKGSINYIVKRLPRLNELTRPNIANIDKALVCVSVMEPSLNLNLLDRFLCLLAFNKIEALIIFTKWDLLKDDDLKDVQEVVNYYQSIGYQCLQTNKYNDDYKEAIYEAIKNKICVITGQSGTGKSSILNILDETLHLKTDEISKALNRGKHTTRYTRLIKIQDGWIADTPGFGNLEFEGMTEIDIAHSFVDLFEASNDCKYKGCLHLGEPGCNVKKMVSAGLIRNSRYDNYLKFIDSIKGLKKW